MTATGVVNRDSTGQGGNHQPTTMRQPQDSACVPIRRDRSDRRRRQPPGRMFEPPDFPWARSQGTL